MAFRFKLAESFEVGVKRIAREQIERAQCQLKNSSDSVVAVHETRKSLKRLRALLRLIRPALGDSGYREENARLREIGHGLSHARDRHVLMETISKLEVSAAGESNGLGQAVRDVLWAANGKDDPAVEATAMKRAQGRLAEAKKRFAQLQMRTTGFDIVGVGLEASYRKARRSFHAAYTELSDEAFHEWRKGTQQHWRHMVLLSRAWTGCLNARVEEARNLSQLLGDDHDLALLVAFVHAQPTGALTPEKIAAIESLARKRQGELRAVAHPHGARLFSEGAKSLRRRVGAYWVAALALKENEPEEHKSKRAPKASPKEPAKEPVKEEPKETAKETAKKTRARGQARRRSAAAQPS